MAGPLRQSTESQATDLFDKYTLPKLALGIILAASLVGTTITVRLTGQWSLSHTIFKWAYFIALGVLMGGLVWKHGFVRPHDFDTDAVQYCRRMYNRFDRIAIGVISILIPTSLYVLYQYQTAGGDSFLVGSLAVLLTLCIGITSYRIRQTKAVDDQFRSIGGIGSLILAVAAVVLTAILEVGFQPIEPITIGIRILHLIAFALWLGGAVWNIFVAVPAGQAYPTTDVIHAAGQQLERFRWIVRIIIPILIITGIHQAIDIFGYQIHIYLNSLIGLAVLTKLGFIGTLVIIFKLCPMWRACSPIDGVCDLTDLNDAQSSNSDSSDASSQRGINDD